MNKAIADIRKDYSLKSLSETDVLKDPFDQFGTWWKEAVESNIDEVNAMALATVKPNQMPSVRIVLLKDFSEKGFTFFTNYNSSKGNEIEKNNNASICFFWKELQRQVRIEGNIFKTSAEVSDEYFNSRPEGSKLGAWVSPQSKIIPNREYLEEREKELIVKFGSKLIRPEHWGGYILKPISFEFWQGRSNRLHDRIHYFIGSTNNWEIERLAP